jgi:hypothetical protein
MQVLKDVAGIELPESLLKVQEEVSRNGHVEVSREE